MRRKVKAAFALRILAATVVCMGMFQNCEHAAAEKTTTAPAETTQK